MRIAALALLVVSCSGSGETPATPLTDAAAPDADAAAGETSAAPRRTRWVVRAGGAGVDGANAVTALPSGEVIVGGMFAGSVDFGCKTLTSDGPKDAFVMKLAAADGQCLWVKQLGWAKSDRVTGLAATADRVLVVGVADDQDLPRPLTSGRLLIAGLSLADGEGWSRTLGGTANDDLSVGVGIGAIDGDAIITGTFRNTLTLDGKSLVSRGAKDVYYARVAGADGAIQWAQRIGGAEDDEVASLAVLPAGFVYLAGSIQGRANVSPDQDEILDGRGERDGFVGRYRTVDGLLVAAKRFGSVGDDFATAVAVDPHASVTVTGTFLSAGVAFETGSVQGSGGTRFFSFQLDKDDQLKWLLAHGGAGNQGGYFAQIIHDEGGNLWAAGHFVSAMTLDAGATVNGPIGVEQCFFAHESGTDGSGGRAYRFGGASPSFARSLARSGKRIFVAGDFAGRAEIESFAVDSAGASDAFVLAFEP